jgi:hypothetical protein
LQSSKSVGKYVGISLWGKVDTNKFISIAFLAFPGAVGIRPLEAGTSYQQAGEDTNMKLTDAFLRGLKASDKEQKHADGGGLYIHVSISGGKLWRRVDSIDIFI